MRKSVHREQCHWKATIVKMLHDSRKHNNHLNNNDTLFYDEILKGRHIDHSLVKVYWKIGPSNQRTSNSLNEYTVFEADGGVRTPFPDVW